MKINKGKVLAAVASVGSLVAGGAMAQTSGTATSYSSILSGLDTSTAITAIIGDGALLAGVGFAKWATKKVARFFG